MIVHPYFKVLSRTAPPNQQRLHADLPKAKAILRKITVAHISAPLLRHDIKFRHYRATTTPFALKEFIVQVCAL